MLDRYSVQWVKAPLQKSAAILDKRGFKADAVTFGGFLVGCLALPLLACQYYALALICIVLNRICDGLDGALARRQGRTDAGGFLDIALDFVFYSLVPLGFVLANPEQNAVAGAVLIFSFIGTGTSFLAFASVAGKHAIDNPNYPHKSLYYMAGIAEGTETIAFLILVCIFPQWFAQLAYGFAVICFLTTANRIFSGYLTLKQLPSSTQRESQGDANESI